MTSTGPEEGPSDYVAVLDESESDEQRNSPVPADEGTAGVRFRALNRPRAGYLQLQGAPIGLIRLTSVREINETSGSRLRPTQDHANGLWDIQNRRRGELLFKRAGSSLTLAERRELDALDSLAERVLLAPARRAMSRLHQFQSPPSNIVTVVTPPVP